MDHNPLESPLALGTMGGRGQMGGHFILPGHLLPSPSWGPESMAREGQNGMEQREGPPAATITPT